jgi:hypothetical protein
MPNGSDARAVPRERRKKGPGIAAGAEAVSFRRRKMIQVEPSKPI